MSLQHPLRFLVLLLRTAVLGILATALAVLVADAPLARLVHEHGAPLKPFFAAVMVGAQTVQQHFFYRGLPVGWLVLLLLFLTLRLLRRPQSTVWLATLLTLISSEATTNLLKVYFNRPRPLDVLGYAAPDAAFWPAAGRFDSFPSGHTAWVAGLLLPAALRFPAARPWLLAAVALVAAGRVALEMHWLSDTLAAVCVALVWAGLFDVLTSLSPLRPSTTPSPSLKKEGN